MKLVDELDKHFYNNFHESQQKSKNLIDSYKKYFSEEEIKTQEWWEICTPDDKSFHAEFYVAHETGCDSPLIDGTEDDQVFFDNPAIVKTLKGKTWRNFVEHSLLQNGCIKLPFPYSTWNSAEFSPQFNGKKIKDPLEMLKLMGRLAYPPDSYTDLTLRQCLKLRKVLTPKGVYPYEMLTQTITNIYNQPGWLDKKICDLIIQEREAINQDINRASYEKADLLLLESILPGLHFPVFTVDSILYEKLANTNCKSGSLIIDKPFAKQGILLLPKQSEFSVVVFGLTFLRSNPNAEIFGISYLSNKVGFRGLSMIPANAVATKILSEWEDPKKNIVKDLNNLLTNIFLYQQSIRTKDDSLIVESPRLTQKGFGKKAQKYINPICIGEGYKPKVIRNYDPVGTHASPRTHWRSGHWRQHMIGSRKNPQHKTIWVEPTLING